MRSSVSQRPPRRRLADRSVEQHLAGERDVDLGAEVPAREPLLLEQIESRSQVRRRIGGCRGAGGHDAKLIGLTRLPGSGSLVVRSATGR